MLRRNARNLRVDQQRRELGIPPSKWRSDGVNGVVIEVINSLCDDTWSKVLQTSVDNWNQQPDVLFLAMQTFDPTSEYCQDIQAGKSVPTFTTGKIVVYANNLFVEAVGCVEAFVPSSFRPKSNTTVITGAEIVIDRECFQPKATFSQLQYEFCFFLGFSVGLRGDRNNRSCMAPTRNFDEPSNRDFVSLEALYGRRDPNYQPPTKEPTGAPIESPTTSPTDMPTELTLEEDDPTLSPTSLPTMMPTVTPTMTPSLRPLSTTANDTSAMEDSEENSNDPSSDTATNPEVVTARWPAKNGLAGVRIFVLNALCDSSWNKIFRTAARNWNREKKVVKLKVKTLSPKKDRMCMEQRTPSFRPGKIVVFAESNSTSPINDEDCARLVLPTKKKGTVIRGAEMIFQRNCFRNPKRNEMTQKRLQYQFCFLGGQTLGLVPSQNNTDSCMSASTNMDTDMENGSVPLLPSSQDFRVLEAMYGRRE